MSHDISAQALLGMGGAVFGVICIVATLFGLKAIREVRARCIGVEASLAAVRRELELMTSISMKTGRRVRKIEHEYSGMADRVDQVEMRGPAQCFDEAIEHARRGADPQTLVSRYGLSRGEAELVSRLHRDRKIA